MGTLNSDIAAALQTGAPLVLNYAEISAAAPSDWSAAVVVAEAPVGQSLSSLYQLSGLLGGEPLLSLAPPGILPQGAITLETVAFTLFTVPQTVGAVSCVLGFSDGQGQPLTWTIAEVNGTPLTFTLTGGVVDWINPCPQPNPEAYLSAGVTGAFTIGQDDAAAVTLDVEVVFPSLAVTIWEPQGEMIGLGGFFRHFGLPTLSILDELYLVDFQLHADVASRAFEVSAVVQTLGASADAPPPPLTLIPGVAGSPALLAFDRLWFGFTAAPGDIGADLGGQLILAGKIALDATAAYDSAAGSWSFSGALDITATAWLINGAPPATPVVTVADVAKVLTGSSNGVPGSIASLGLAALEVDYTYAEGAASSYTFIGAFGDWTLPGTDITVQLGVEISDRSQFVSADVLVDGRFEFTASWLFGPDEVIDVAIGPLGLTGTYDVTNHAASISIADHLSISDLLAWFVGSATGNRYFTLPRPWSDIFDGLSLPTGIFTLDTLTHKVTCVLNVSAKTLFGVSISGISLAYDPAARTGGSGLSLRLLGSFPGGITPSWDPGTEQPPVVPGTGAALLDIRMAAAGQHVGFASAPTSVTGAVTALAAALQPDAWNGGLVPSQLSFSTDLGWLVGLHVVVLGQADLQLIFNDPTIYGLDLQVTGSGQDPPTKLDALAGLSAEIIYRKVSDTIGEYAGTLTFPDSLRYIDLGGVQITLPCISLSIYTNGDFKVDVGFPYHRDFSRSFAVNTPEYAGAGGFYFAKLDGLDPTELPQLAPADQGVFDPVTELGLGFEIGVARSFSSGPLSGGLSLMVQGLFQGVFAKFTRYCDGAHDEYYSIEATVAFVGQLWGEIDFAIITASLQVSVYIEVDLLMVAHAQTVATASVGVSVSLTVSIDLGLFSIDIHCSFSTSVTEQVAFGATSEPKWVTSTAAAQLADGRAPRAKAWISSPVWQPITDTNALTVYVLPQLTAAAASGWIYVAQLGLNNPAATAQPVDPTASFAAFVRGVLRWALNATLATSTAPAAAADVDTRTVSLAQAQALLQAMNPPPAPPGQAPTPPPARPAVGDVQALFQQGFQTTIKPPAKGEVSGASLGVGFFPLLPGMTFNLQPAQAAARAMTPGPAVRRADLAAQRRAGPLGRRQPASVTLADDTPVAPADLVIEDYVAVVACGALQSVADRADLWSGALDPTIGAVVGALDDAALSSISGMATRFMLHGARILSGGQEQALYAATGQSCPLTAQDLAAANLALGLTLDAASAQAWGVGLAGGAATLTLSSDDPEGAALFAPKAFPIQPQLSFAATVAAAPWGVLQPERFALAGGIDVANVSSATLWPLPAGLLTVLGGATGYDFSLWAVGPGAADAQVPADAYAWALSVDVHVRRLPTAGATAGPAPTAAAPGGVFLANTYELAGVDPAGLARLERLIGDIDPTTAAGPVTGLSLAFRTEPSPSPTEAASGPSVREAVLTSFDGVSTFLVQNNFSTDTKPPLGAAALAATLTAQELASLIYRLWSAGVTNSGGYYLFYADAAGDGLPESLFDANGVAALSIVIGLAPLAADAPPYATHVQTRGYPAQAATSSLYLASPDLAAPKALLAPGQVGVQVTRAPPAPPSGNGAYGDTLERLYNLISMNVVSVGGVAQPPALPAVVGPVDPAAPPQAPARSRLRAAGDPSPIWTYYQAFALVDGGAPSTGAAGGGPPGAQNPYQYIGQAVDFDLVWTDLYGNLGEALSPSLAVPLAYSDPLISLGQLPYLSLAYDFSAEDAAQLTIGFTWLPPTYGSGDGARRSNDIATYARACHQLAPTLQDDTVTATVTTPLAAGGSATVDVGILRQNLAALYDALVAAAPGGPAAASPTLASISVALNPSDPSVAGDLYFPLTVSLDLARTGPVAQPFAADGPVARSTTPVPPNVRGATPSASAALTDANDTTLLGFAGRFEAALAAYDLKLGVGPVESAATALKSEQVWVIRYGTSGIGASFDAAHVTGYAPRPLANTLLARDNIPVRTLTQGVLSEAGAVVSVSAVDLDAEMRRFLAAFDAIFSPENFIPAALIDGDAVTRLSGAKQAVVEAFLLFVTDLGNGVAYDPSTDFDPSAQTPTTPLGWAADKYRQACAVRLGAFYDMSAVFVAPLVATFGSAPSETTNLFATPVLVPTASSSDPAPAAPEFTLTSGKAALATQPTSMAIGIYPKNPAHHARFTAALQFPIGGLEHGVRKVSLGPTTYRAGAWLKFVIPPPALCLASVDIPLPIRAFPTAPQLIAQRAVDAADPAAFAAPDQNVRLAAAKSWALAGRYALAYVAQDTLLADVLLNAAPSSGAHGDADAATKDLLDALVEFNTLYPQLQQIFLADTLSKHRTPGGTVSPALHAALDSLATLAETVAQCAWTLRPTSVGEALAATSASPVVRRSTYTVDEAALGPNPADAWSCVVTLQDDVAAPVTILPQLRLPGYTTTLASQQPAAGIAYGFTDADGQPLTAKAAWALTERALRVQPLTDAVPDLNILDRQSGRIGLQVLRNAALQPPFRYATPWVTFKEILTPSLDRATPIEMAGVGAPGGLPVPRTVAAHFQAFFMALLAGSGTGEQVAGSLRATLAFSAPATASPDLDALRVRLPVALLLPTAVTYGLAPTSPAPDFVTTLSAKVAAWLEASGLGATASPQVWAASRLVLDVSLYSSLGIAGAPILRLREVELSCAYITG